MNRRRFIAQAATAAALVPVAVTLPVTGLSATPTPLAQAMAAWRAADAHCRELEQPWRAAEAVIAPLRDAYQGAIKVSRQAHLEMVIGEFKVALDETADAFKATHGTEPPQEAIHDFAMETLDHACNRAELRPEAVTAWDRETAAKAAWQEAEDRLGLNALNEALDEADDRKYDLLDEAEMVPPASLAEWLEKLEFLALARNGVTYHIADFLDLAVRDLAALGVSHTPSPEAMALERNYRWGPAPSGAGGETA